MLRKGLLVVIAGLLLSGCQGPGPRDPAQSREESPHGPFQPFTVYRDKGARDNHFVPSGFMPDGDCLSFNDAWMNDCYEGKTCIKIVYDVACSRAGQKWAGIYLSLIHI